MAWNGHGSAPPPPPPPGPAPPGGHNGPYPGHGPYPGFWEFIHSLDPTYRAGSGVDHTASYPPFGHGVAFGPGGFEAWSGRSGWGRRGWRGGGRRHPWAWDGPGPWDGQRGQGWRGRRGQASEEDIGDDEPTGDEVDMRDAAAAAAAADAEKGEHDVGGGTVKGDGPDGEFPDPPEENPWAYYPRRGRHGRQRGAFAGRGGRCYGARGPHHHGGPPPYGAPGASSAATPFDFSAMMNAFADHPFAQRLRSYVETMNPGATQARDTADNVGAGAGHTEGVLNNDNDDNNEDASDDENVFVPPVDVFNTGSSWTLHIALPGAKKEDVGVNWDAHKSTLSVSGVVYRPGDEPFLAGLVAGERKVGLFSRTVRLPPAGVEEKDEIDAEGITARMEDGLLIVVVPKLEKDWTEVRKVDIE